MDEETKDPETPAVDGEVETLDKELEPEVEETSEAATEATAPVDGQI